MTDLTEVTPESDSGEKTKQIQRRVLEAYCRTSGNVSKACALARVSRESHYRWLREDEAYQQQFKFAEDELVDQLEQAVIIASMADWRAALAVLERLRPKRWNKDVVADIEKRTAPIEDNKIEIVFVDSDYAEVEDYSIE